MNRMTGFVVLGFFILCSSCTKSPPSNPPGTWEQVYIHNPDSASSSTIIIRGLTLVTRNAAAERGDALEILMLKVQWPLAMQTKDRNLFETILASDFTFRAEDEFFARPDYIEDRVAGTWEIDTVKYENLVLQFFDESALLTYRNVLKGTDTLGTPDIEHYAWADMYTRKDGRWRILGSHCIDARVEYPGN
ncbi:MAG: nuclear transport factor 2 family protein [Bacteroidota bacterium]